MLISDEAEITSPFVHLIFSPYLPDLQTQNPQNSLLFLRFCVFRSNKSNLNLSASLRKLFRPRPLNGQRCFL